MLSKRHAAALALIAGLVAPGSFSAPALAQEFPEVTVLRSTPVFRNPGHRPFQQFAKGERVTLHAPNYQAIARSRCAHPVAA